MLSQVYEVTFSDVGGERRLPQNGSSQ